MKYLNILFSGTERTMTLINCYPPNIDLLSPIKYAHLSIIEVNKPKMFSLNLCILFIISFGHENFINTQFVLACCSVT